MGWLRPGVVWTVLGAAALMGAGWLAPVASAVDVTVDTTTKYQKIEGFGTCTINWMPNVSALYDTQKFRDFYGDDLGGSIVRFHLAPDLQKEPDLDLENLDLSKFNWDAPDLKHAAEFAKAIYLKDPKRNKIITSIWSPPAWMKTNDETANGGSVRPDRFDNLGKYIVGISRSFEAKFGVPLYAISIQNELSFKEPYDSCQVLGRAVPPGVHGHREGAPEVAHQHQDHGSRADGPVGGGHLAAGRRGLPQARHGRPPGQQGH